ncbi:Uncharacterised protein [Streptococcus pneumoniae]|nr:Uncharacterised protein [Streptococcus pneumoniae]
MVPITTNPIIQEMIAAGPAIDDASQAPNNQPEPINDPNPSNTNWGRLILLLFDSVSFLFAILTPHSFIF